MKILLAVDGSAFTKKMLAYLAAHDLFSANNAYTVLTVQLPLPPQARAALGKDTVQKYHDDEGQRIMTPVLKFLQRHGITAKTLCKAGHPGDTIAKLAEEGQFDLIVMGSHGHSALANLVLGSVANRVLANSKVPVLLVR